MKNNRSYWIVSREFAGLAEAGGVKDVASSLAKGFSSLHWDVTAFLPLYGCTSITNVENFDLVENISATIKIGDAIEKVVFSEGYFQGIHVVFVVNKHFTSKMGVYTYTRLEEALNKELRSGQGHVDARLISILFQKAVIEYGVLLHSSPDVFHCQDAHTSLIPFLVNKNKKTTSHYCNTKFFITIHNAGSVYRDQCDSIEQASNLLNLPKEDFLEYSIAGKPEPFLLSQDFATFTTVSPWYAKELFDVNNHFSEDISKFFVSKKFNIKGITNGIDIDLYNPDSKKKSFLPFVYNPQKGNLKGKYQCRKHFLSKYNKIHVCTDEKKIDRIFQHGILDETENTEKKPVYFSFHARLVHQKGIDVLTEAARIVLSSRPNARFIIIGQGAKVFEDVNIEFAKKYFGKYIYFQGYDKALSRLCIAVSDFLVLPSFFEPCGLQDFIGQIYGTLPIAHACGGLNKILHEKTGFLYYKNDAQTLANTLIDLIDRMEKEPKYFDKMIAYSAKYVKTEYSWEKIIKEKYLPLCL